MLKVLKLLLQKILGFSFYSLSGEPAAVDWKDMSVYEIGGFGGEQDNRTEKVVQLAQMLQGDSAKKPLLKLPL